MVLDDVSSWIMAAAALGSAAFGFVEALKAKGWIGLAGMRELRNALNRPAQGVLMRMLKSVYGDEEFETLLETTYRRGPSDTSEFLRNGLRLAMSNPMDGEQQQLAARALGQDPAALKRAYELVAQVQLDDGPELDLLAQRKIIGQAELVIDARVEAAVCHADAVLAGRKRWVAGVFALAASLSVTLLGEEAVSDKALARALLIGLAAVPVAPVARDLVSLLQSARDALRGRTA